MEGPDAFREEDLGKCIDFHGHMCPGLAIGYRASKTGLERLKENRSEDEEIVAIVETDACCADAVQVISGCTFGKGNFIFKDYGKMAFTFFSRNTGEGIRLALKPSGMDLSERHKELIATLRENKATKEEREEFGKIHQEKSMEILNLPLDDLFNIKAVHFPLPEKAKVEPSEICDQCGEMTMASKLKETDGRRLCHACSI